MIACSSYGRNAWSLTASPPWKTALLQSITIQVALIIITLLITYSFHLSLYPRRDVLISVYQALHFALLATQDNEYESYISVVWGEKTTCRCSAARVYGAELNPNEGRGFTCHKGGGADSYVAVYQWTMFSQGRMCCSFLILGFMLLGHCTLAIGDEGMATDILRYQRVC